ncbi:flagellin [Agarivorans sp. TSD2052]|uniref:flagellin n=1 Tax=Agarivorans sp. TSD2052 TaxID=2937286 RepID=UPI00200D3A5C|nr:flagellin [Agarivorans sp. TSD2052]UPW19056.1 flagellin [Agarivorans sp. TSD2052]
MPISQVSSSVAPSDFYLEQAKKRQEEQDEKLASGKKINSAADDPAGLQISNRLTTGISEQEAYANIYQNQVSINNIESAQLQGTTDLLQQNQALAVQSGNGIYNSDDIAALQAQVDANTAAIPNAAELGVDNVDVSDPAAAQAALQGAQQTTDSSQAQLGAQSNAAESAYRSTQAAIEAQSAARSRILDTNYAQSTSQQAQNDAVLQSSIQSYQQQLASKNIEKLI